MSYPIEREPKVRHALDEFLTELAFNLLDMQYSLSEAESLSNEDQEVFNSRYSEMSNLHRTCTAFKQSLWTGETVDVR